MAGEDLAVGISYSDRISPILQGKVKSPDIELKFEFAPVDQIFWRGLHSSDFDLIEMSLAAHCILKSRGDRRFIGLPIFTSRIFRHNSVYVAGNSPITSPSELAGKRIGVPEYQMTAAVWMRGIFGEHYGLDLRSVHWIAGGVDRPGRKERIDLKLPDEYKFSRIPESQTLSTMLVDGQIDALICAKMPRAFSDGSGHIKRLFPSARAEEERYFNKTGFIPIMHLCVLRRECYERKPVIARQVYDLFSRAREVASHDLYDTDLLRVMSPWLIYEIEAAHSVLGRDYWSYGVQKNRQCLDIFLRYLSDQGLLEKPIGIEDIFLTDLET